MATYLYLTWTRTWTSSRLKEMCKLWRDDDVLRWKCRDRDTGLRRDQRHEAQQQVLVHGSFPFNWELFPFPIKETLKIHKKISLRHSVFWRNFIFSLLYNNLTQCVFVFYLRWTEKYLIESCVNQFKRFSSVFFLSLSLSLSLINKERERLRRCCYITLLNLLSKTICSNLHTKES